MNAFMALKNTDQEKDVKWIQNFLSESLVEDIPWECSKALIILKEGYQAIIPREASRSILLGKFTDRIIAIQCDKSASAISRSFVGRLRGQILA